MNNCCSVIGCTNDAKGKITRIVDYLAVSIEVCERHGKELD